MYLPDGSLVDDVAVRRPRFSRFYQMFDFALLEGCETEEGRDAERGNLSVSLKSTWRGVVVGGGAARAAQKWWI